MSQASAVCSPGGLSVMANFANNLLAGQITLMTFTGHFFNARQDKRTLITKTKVFH
jgi:hypothetical protein